MIYLDHAATSWPKPAEVPAAVTRWYAEVGVSAERGDGPGTRQAAATIAGVRRAVARMVGTSATQVAFVSGATEGLNLALRALLAPGSRVLTTAFEHSSVVRPLVAHCERHGATVVRADGAPDAAATGRALLRALADDAFDLLVFTHASNVTGAVLDAAAICRAARERGVRTVVDASQTAGLLPIDVGADVLVASGHKALHGPPGTGFVALRDGIALAPQKHGGTGSSAALERHPEQWPQAFEAGTPNTPGLFGLAAALQWIEREGTDTLLRRSLDAVDRFAAGLDGLAQVRHFAPGSGPRVPVLSFVHEAYDPLELGGVLAAAGVHVRTGFHCAPWIHEPLGTAAAGTVRVSTGPHTTADDVDAALAVLRSL